MKHVLRAILINFAAFFAAIRIIDTITFGEDWGIFFFVAVVLFLGSFIIKPFLKIVFFIPLNFLTMHLAGLSTNILILFAISSLVPEFKILPYYFPGFLYQGFIIPQVQLNFIGTIVATSLIISLSTAVLNWLVD